MKKDPYRSTNFSDARTMRWILAGMLIAAATIGTTADAAENLAESERRDADDARANQVARDVFASDAYWWKRTSNVKSTSAIGRFFSFVYEWLILPIVKAIGELIEWILDRLSGRLVLPGGDWSQGVPFLWTISAVLVFFAVWWVAIFFRRQPVVRPAPSGQTSIEVLPQADQLLEQSRMALAKGDHRSAVRLALLSLLAWLQNRGQLKYDASRSNREYQQDLRRWPESAAVFGAVAAPFERCWYGGRDLDHLQVQQLIALCGNHFQVAKDST